MNSENGKMEREEEKIPINKSLFPSYVQAD